MPSINISVAVPTLNGFVTPIIFNADQLSIVNISDQIQKLTKQANENKLKPNEFQGGNFSLIYLFFYIIFFIYF